MMNRIKKSPLSKVHKRNSKKKPWNMNRNPARKMNWGCKSKIPFKIEANFSRFPNMDMKNCVRHENYVEQQIPNGNVYGVHGRCFHDNHNGAYGNPKFGQRTDLGPYLQGEHMVGRRYGPSLQGEHKVGYGYEQSSLQMAGSPFRRRNKGFNGDPQPCHNDPIGNLCLNECNNNGFRHGRCHASSPFGSNKKEASMARSDGPRRHFRPRPQSGNDVRPCYLRQRQHPHLYRHRNGAFSKQHKSLIHNAPTRDGEISLDHLDASTPRDGEIMLHVSPSPLRAPPAPHNTTSFILHHKWLSEMCLDMTPPVSPRSTTTTQKDDDWSIIDYTTSVRQVLRQEKFEKELREAQENKVEHNKNEHEHEPNVINEDDPSLNDNEEEDVEDCVSSPYDECEREDDLESIGDNIDQDQDLENRL